MFQVTAESAGVNTVCWVSEEVSCGVIPDARADQGLPFHDSILITAP